MAKNRAKDELEETEKMGEETKETNQTPPPLPVISKFNEPKFVDKMMPANQFINTIHEKKQIFLHHTAGSNAKSALAWWNQTPVKVGTAFIIDRDGSIWKCFDEKHFAYHLGLEETHDLDKSSIGIEIAAWGPLKKKGDRFFAYPGDYSKIEVPKEDVVEFKEAFRGFNYFHKYSDNQIKAVCELIVYLHKKFPNIPLPKKLGKFYEYNSEVITKRLPGLYSHSTVRKDKSDIIPQPNFLEELQKALDYCNSI